MIRILAGFAVGISLMTSALPQAFAQQQVQTAPADLVKGFVYAVYHTNQDPLEIASKYIGLQAEPNALSLAARYQGAAEHIAEIRRKAEKPPKEGEPPLLFNPAADTVLSYQEARNRVRIPMELTSEQRKLLYVLIENGKPGQYFAVRDNKILSFFLFEKGTNGPGYFLFY